MNESKVCPVCRNHVPDNEDAALTDASCPWAMHMEYDVHPDFQLWHGECWNRAAMLVGVDNTEAWRAA
jgi:hypothetical protein